MAYSEEGSGQWEAKERGKLCGEKYERKIHCGGNYTQVKYRLVPLFDGGKVLTDQTARVAAKHSYKKSRFISTVQWSRSAPRGLIDHSGTFFVILHDVVVSDMAWWRELANR